MTVGISVTWTNGESVEKWVEKEKLEKKGKCAEASESFYILGN